MENRNTQKKLLVPYFWILLILAFPVLIINAGAGSQQKDQTLFHEADEASQLLDSLVNGANESVFLANLARSLTKSLGRIVSETVRQNADPHRHFLRPDFPEHEIWVFTNEALFYPDRITTSRRAMYRLFQAINRNDFSDGQNKLADFLFGPGLKIRHLALIKGRPTRILYQKRYCQMIWNSFTTETGVDGGFFLIVPESDKLKRYVMEFSSRAITRSTQDIHNGKIWWRGGGYLKLFAGANPSVLPKFVISAPELKRFLNNWCKPAQLSKLEQTNLPWGLTAGRWKLFSRAIPDSAHLAIVFLPETSSNSETSKLPVFVNTLYAVFTAVLLFCFLFGKMLPAMSLKTRFSLIFLALAAVPFSLFFIAFNIFAGEHEASLVREARQKLENAIARYDEGIEEIYQNLRAQLLQIENAEWIKQAIRQKNPVSQNLALQAGKFLESFSPKLPWGAINFSDPEGNVATAFKSEPHRLTLEGYARFNRVGIIEAMRKNLARPSIETSRNPALISDSDIALKKAYENQSKLPIYHPFSNANVGNAVQVAHGSDSIMRFVSYFPDPQRPVMGLSIEWLEKDLDAVFVASAIQKIRREFSWVRFEAFRKENDDLYSIARSHQDSDMRRTARVSSLRNGLFFRTDQMKKQISLALPSKRQLGIFLAGSMDTAFIDERLALIDRAFLAFFLFGLFALLFFQNYLFKRLIQAFILLEKFLNHAREDLSLKLPNSRRSDEIADIFKSFNEMTESLRVRERLMSLVSEGSLQIVRTTGEGSDSTIRKVPAISLTSDIRGFTTLCETHPPETITQMLNQHFEQMSRIILSQGGEINRFVGDAIEASFACNGEKPESTVEQAMRAAVMMLQAMPVINNRRSAHGLFTYKIGIGMAFGTVSFFPAGRASNRTEVLQIGEAIKRSSQLEALSRHFPAFPLVMDREIAEFSRKTGQLLPAIREETIDDIKCWSFLTSNPAEDFLSFSASENLLPAAAKSETVSEKLLVAKQFDKEKQKFMATRVSFWKGAAFLCLPIILCCSGIWYGFNVFREMVRKNAHLENTSILRSATAMHDRLEIAAIRLNSLVTSFCASLPEISEKSAEEKRQSLKKSLRDEMTATGLSPTHIIFSGFPDRKKDSIVADTLSLEAQLKILLEDCLRCYGSSLNRYLIPGHDSIKVLQSSVTGIAISRDNRGNFIPATVASQSCLVYWQPVISPRSIPDSAAIRYLSPNHDNWQLRKYGLFDDVLLPQFVVGGILILCRSLDSATELNYSPPVTEAGFAELNLKNGGLRHTISESQLKLLSKENQHPASLSEQLVAICHRSEKPENELVTDKMLVQNDGKRLFMVFNQTGQALKTGKRYSTGLLLLLTTMALAMTISWFLGTREKGLARKVEWQIFSSFIGVILLPVAGIILIICLIYGGWQQNLIENSKTGFLQKVARIEEKMQFSHFEIPRYLRNILQKASQNRFNISDREISTTASASCALRGFLSDFFTEIVQTRRGFGINSMMIEFAAGPSEFLQINGSFADDSDPMKNTFSFLTGRIIERLAGANLAMTSKRTAKQIVVQEMAAEMVFEALASTFGENTIHDILFGQEKGISLFGGVSKDVIHQIFFPDAIRPEGVILLVLSHFHIDTFALGRILAAENFFQQHNDPLAFKIHAINRINPGMPLLPETGERYPFLRDIGRQAKIVGHIERTIRYDNEDYYVYTFQSNSFPKFIFLGFARLSDFSAFINRKLIWFGVMLAFFVMALFMLATQTAADITGPLKKLLHSIGRVNAGDFNFSLTFQRHDELENIAAAFSDMVKKLAEKETLSRMVSQSASQMATSEEAENEAKKGRKQLAAVVYFGIARFDEFLKKNDDETIRNAIDEWVSTVSQKVIEAGGEVDKIMEGKILAVFFADSDKSSTAKQFIASAFTAAAEICLTSHNGLKTLCGIHAGEVIAGLMGSQQRRDFTVIGDPVNLAARCFSQADALRQNTAIVATEEAAAGLPGGLKASDLGHFAIKGKKDSRRLFSVSKV